jgi:hypothetical protein
VRRSPHPVEAATRDPPTIGATFVQGAHLPATHLTDHALRGTGLPEVISRAHQSRLTMQMPSNDRARGRH